MPSRKSKYPLGTQITFRDYEALTTTADAAIVTGTVNGKPIENPENDILLIPVFCDRDYLAPTTIYVAEPNVLKRKLPAA